MHVGFKRDRSKLKNSKVTNGSRPNDHMRIDNIIKNDKASSNKSCPE